MRYAICNETFEGWEHSRVCDFVAATGYTGLELAPFTLAPLITDVTPSQLARLRQEAEGSDLQIIGLHWLLAKTQGFMLTSPDAEVRKRTAQYLAELAIAARELGGDLLVLGSPVQRKIPTGATHQQAEDYAADTLSRTLKTLEKERVYLTSNRWLPRKPTFFKPLPRARGSWIDSPILS